jgi:hypothetical protein
LNQTLHWHKIALFLFIDRIFILRSDQISLHYLIYYQANKFVKYFKHIFKPLLKYFYLTMPKLFNILESILHSHIIRHEYSMCSLIICTCNCSKSFLTSSVPYLQFNNIFSYFNRSLLILMYLNLKSTPIVAR